MLWALHLKVDDDTLNLRVEKVVNLPPFSSSCSELVNTCKDDVDHDDFDDGDGDGDHHGKWTHPLFDLWTSIPPPLDCCLQQYQEYLFMFCNNIKNVFLQHVLQQYQEYIFATSFAIISRISFTTFHVCNNVRNIVFANFLIKITTCGFPPLDILNNV